MELEKTLSNLQEEREKADKTQGEKKQRQVRQT